jgi:hypothetical protein
MQRVQELAAGLKVMCSGHSPMLHQRVGGMCLGQGDLLIMRKIEIVDGKDHCVKIMWWRGELFSQRLDLKSYGGERLYSIVSSALNVETSVHPSKLRRTKVAVAALDTWPFQ